jgi:hypothetical protein
MHMTVTLAIPSPRDIAIDNLNRALRVYNRLASPMVVTTDTGGKRWIPRRLKPKAWAYVAERLWRARANALLAGALRVDSQPWVFVTDRIHDAESQGQFLQLLEERSVELAMLEGN